MIAARCEKCGHIGCNNDNLICNNNLTVPTPLGNVIVKSEDFPNWCIKMVKKLISMPTSKSKDLAILEIKNIIKEHELPRR